MDITSFRMFSNGAESNYDSVEFIVYVSVYFVAILWIH